MDYDKTEDTSSNKYYIVSGYNNGLKYLKMGDFFTSPMEFITNKSNATPLLLSEASKAAKDMRCQGFVNLNIERTNNKPYRDY